MEPAEDELLVNVSSLLFNRRQFRAPFKVHVVEWNPQQDLVALASKKGDVLVKRCGWKNCWQLNIFKDVQIGDKNEPRSGSVDTMAWNPTGNVLAVGTSDAYYHLIEMDTGTVRWSHRIVSKDNIPVTFLNLRWFVCPRALSEVKLGVPLPEDWQVVADVNIDGTDKKSEVLGIENIYRSRLKNTLLLATRDDNKISIIAAGIISIAVIDLDQICGSIGLTPIGIFDVLLSENRTINVGVSTYGPRPHCGGDGNFGVPVVPPDAVVSAHTHVFNIKVEMDDLEFIWNVIERYIKIHNRFILMHTVMETIIKEWETNSKIFHNRIWPSSQNMNIGEILVSTLLSGMYGHAAETFMDKHICGGLSGFRDEVVTHINGSLSNIARSLAYHMEELQADIDDKAEIAAKCCLFPGRNSDVNSYPYDIRQLSTDSKSDVRDMASVAQSILVKTKEASLVATANLKEIYTMVRWFATLPMVLNSNNATGKKNFCKFARQMDTVELLKYMIENFMSETHPKRDVILKCLFDIDGIIKEKIEEENEPGYSEEKYLKDFSLIESLVKQSLYPSVDSDKEAHDAMKRVEKITGDDNPKEELEQKPSTSEPLTVVPPEILTSDTGCGTSDDKTPVVPQDATMLSPGSGKDQPVSKNPTPSPVKDNFVLKLDRISDFWEANEEGEMILSPQTLKLLKSDRHETDPTTLAGVLREAKTLFDQVQDYIATLAVVDKVNWLYEVESSPDHTSFKGLHLTSGTIPEKERVTSISVVAHTEQKCLHHVLLPAGCSSRWSGFQQDLAIDLHSNVKVKTLKIVNDDQPMEQDGGLSIITQTELLLDDHLAEIVEAGKFSDGHLYVMATTKNDQNGQVRRLFRIKPNMKHWQTHEHWYRLDQMESLHMSPDGKRGCSLSDEATRVAVFTTFESKEASSATKAEYDEEYRQATAAKERKIQEPAYFHAFDEDRVMRIQADELDMITM